MHVCVRYHIRERAKQQSCDLRCQCLPGSSNCPIAENFSMNVQLGILIKTMNAKPCPMNQVPGITDELGPSTKSQATNWSKTGRILSLKACQMSARRGTATHLKSTLGLCISKLVKCLRGYTYNYMCFGGYAKLPPPVVAVL